MLIDVQNTFCIPGFELFVGGGTGAVDDGGYVSSSTAIWGWSAITPTMDTIRNANSSILFWIDAVGVQSCTPATTITLADIEQGVLESQSSCLSLQYWQRLRVTTKPCFALCWLSHQGKYPLISGGLPCHVRRYWSCPGFSCRGSSIFSRRSPVIPRLAWN